MLRSAEGTRVRSCSIPDIWGKAESGRAGRLVLAFATICKATVASKSFESRPFSCTLTPQTAYFLMAFRKRNVALGGSASNTAAAPSANESIPGVKPSPLTSHPVTSTGSSSLDSLLGGHGGFALGSSLFIEESGMTDYAGALLKYYAAEGICQGHIIHLVGMGDHWIRQLPGVAVQNSSSRREQSPADEEKMKIAWRYERQGQAGERGAWQCSLMCKRSI